MNSFDIIQRYRNLMNEEKNFNYKYNPILNSEKDTIFISSHKSFNTNNINIIKKIKFLSPKKEILMSKNKELNNKNNEQSLLNKKSNQNHIIPKTPINKKINNLKNLKNYFTVSEDIFNANLYYKNKKNEKIKTFFIKSHCPFCKKILMEKENNKDNKNDLDNNNINVNIYRNKKFKDIKSCFIYNVNNFPLLNTNIIVKSEFKEKLYGKEKEKCITTTKRSKRTNMESELTKSNKVIKFREIQRKEIDPTDLYLIKKPLIPSIRGKYFMNTKKRLGKPMRIILINEEEYIPYD